MQAHSKSEYKRLKAQGVDVDALASPPTLHVSELHEGEENDGPLESTDLFLRGDGWSLLVNVPAGSNATYSLCTAGKCEQSGSIEGAPAPSAPPPDSLHTCGSDDDTCWGCERDKRNAASAEGLAALVAELKRPENPASEDYIADLYWNRALDALASRLRSAQEPR